MAVRCLSVVACLRACCCLCGRYWLLCGVCCLLFVVRCDVLFVYCVLFNVCCLLSIACWLALPVIGCCCWLVVFVWCLKTLLWFVCVAFVGW